MGSSSSSYVSTGWLVSVYGVSMLLSSKDEDLRCRSGDLELQFCVKERKKEQEDGDNGSVSSLYYIYFYIIFTI